ncbi:hypothetical protein AB0I85_27405 [Micromonospora echinofusca]|uniref:hypothetical protein n=1 Tax=Micromonospora echinofusca TaxID=47858 RepID=UPI0033D6E196
MSTSEAGGPTDGPVKRGLRSTVGRESTTFGFSILVTVNFGLLNAMEGSPGVFHIFLFAIGAVLSFTLLEGLLSRGFRKPMPQHHTHVQAVGTSMNLLSVVGGLGCAWLAATWIAHPAVWAVAPFLAAVVYLVFESLETALGERLLKATEDPEADDVSS